MDLQEQKDIYFNGRERMNPELENILKSNTTELAENPAFPKTDINGNPINFLELIAYKRFNDVVKNVKRFTNLQNVTGQNGMGQLTSMLMQSFTSVVQMEKPHIEELENLAVDLVVKEMEIPDDVFNFNCKIVRQGEINQDGFQKETKNPQEDEIENQFGEEAQVENMTPAELFELEKHKRRFVNLLIQGSSKKGHYMFELVRDKINNINPQLANNYGIMMSINDIIYWLLSDETIKSMASQPQNMGGKEEIEVENENESENETGLPTIKTEAVCFPIAVHEVIKGIMEVFGTKGLPDDPKSSEMIIDGVDSLSNETMDLRLGVVIWEKFREQLPQLVFEEGNKYLQHYLFSRFCALDTKEFFVVAKQIMSNDPKGAKYMQRMTDQIISDLNVKEFEGNQDDNNEDDINIDDLFNYKKGGKVKTIKESDIQVGQKFNLMNGEIIEINRLFIENYDENWVEYSRDGEIYENSVNNLKNFINNWRAETSNKTKFAKGGEIYNLILPRGFYVRINPSYTATIRNLNDFENYLKRKDEIFGKQFGEITNIDKSASKEWVDEFNYLISRKKAELNNEQIIKYEVGQPITIFRNQAEREGIVIAVIGNEILVEYTMPNGTSALNIIDTSLPEYDKNNYKKNYIPISYDNARISKKWSSKIDANGLINNPQGSSRNTLPTKRFADGGKINSKNNYDVYDNKRMLLNQANEIEHHSEELNEQVKITKQVPAWVIAKMERATTDLSDITHYLDGENKMAYGGSVDGQRYDVVPSGDKFVVVRVYTKAGSYSAKNGVIIRDFNGNQLKFNDVNTAKKFINNIEPKYPYGIPKANIGMILMASQLLNKKEPQQQQQQPQVVYYVPQPVEQPVEQPIEEVVERNEDIVQEIPQMLDGGNVDDKLINDFCITNLIELANEIQPLKYYVTDRLTKKDFEYKSYKARLLMVFKEPASVKVIEAITKFIEKAKDCHHLFEQAVSVSGSQPTGVSINLLSDKYSDLEFGKGGKVYDYAPKKINFEKTKIIKTNLGEYILSLITKDFVYFVNADESDENAQTIMYNKKGELLSDNIHATNDLFETLENQIEIEFITPDLEVYRQNLLKEN